MLVETARQNLLTLVDAYRKRTREPLPVVSKRFYGNRAFLAAFKKGEKSITLTKLETMVQTFRAQWPEGLPWPELPPIPMNPPAK